MWTQSPNKVQAGTQAQAESSKDSAASIATLIDNHQYDEANIAILRLIAAAPGTTGEYVADLSSTLTGEVCNKYGIPAAQASAQLLRHDLDAYWTEARRIGALTNDKEALFSLARKDAAAMVNLATACSAQCFDDDTLNQSCVSLVRDLGLTDSETSCSQSPRYPGECVPYNLLQHVVEDNPTNSSAWTKLGALYLQGIRMSQDGDKGADAEEQAITYKSDNIEALLLLSSHYLAEKPPSERRCCSEYCTGTVGWCPTPAEKAVSLLKRALPLISPDTNRSNYALCQLARAYTMTGQINDAASALAKVTGSLDMGTAAVCSITTTELKKVGDGEFAKNDDQARDYQRAAVAYEAIVNFICGAGSSVYSDNPLINDVNADLLVNLLISQDQVHHYEKALEVANQLRDPDQYGCIGTKNQQPDLFYEWVANYARGGAAFSLGRYAESILGYEAVRASAAPKLQDTMSLKDYVRLGYSYLVLGDYEHAEAVFEEASKLHPENEELYARSLIAAEAKGGPEEVDTVWQRRSYMTQDHVRDSWLVDQLMEVAEEADRRGMRYRSLSQYSRVFGLTDSYHAKVAYDQFDPSTGSRSSDSTALKALRRVFETYAQLPLKPAPPRAASDFERQGEADVRNQNYMAARNHYFEAMLVAPWWPELHYNLGLVQWAGGNSSEALREMNLYLYLAPQGQYANDARRKATEFNVRYKVKP
jgi:tetratricopeptide (TPR) repeat protein